MSVTVHLVRHAHHPEVGRTLSGRSEIALSAEGVDQAARLGALFAETPLTAIHASPRARAVQTAMPVARHHALPVDRIAALDEIDFGDWTGRRFDALDKDADWQTWNARRASAPSRGGETMPAAVARAVAHLDAQVDGELLCVSHADIIRGVIAHYLGLSLDHILRFDVDPASRSTLVLDGGTGRLLSLNEGAR